ncbi:MAG: molybdopterin-binding/glycosyltransferase family 2 protein [Sneathiella sp.]|nr:molybdopterin-binding/glycosyltransferase family 2 protein [Sneathiella sp.]
MIFTRLSLSDAMGAILAHAVEAGPLGLLKKGYVLDAEALEAISDTGQETVLAAKLEAGDVPENEAALAIASPLAGKNVTVKTPFTGRSNLISDTSGIVRINKPLLNKINRIDPSITIATVKDFEKIDKNQMLATVKIIPFSAPSGHVDQATEYADSEKEKLISVFPFQTKKIGVISTRLPKTTDKLIVKSEKVLSDRLADCQNTIAVRKITDHHEEAVEAALHDLIEKECDLILIFGASAITDIRDVIPTAIKNAGGRTDHFGMPVDPGNLLLIGNLKNSVVVGLPGCSRSPKLNGFDWVLQRLLCDLDVTADDIMGMGEGGLLKEIASRPQPRAGKSPSRQTHKKKKIAVLLLAAGQSRRMGPDNKLLALVNNKPMVRHVAEQALASNADHVLMVTGHEADDVLKSIWDLDISSVQNFNYANGLSTSLKVGFEVLRHDYDGVLVCLGDMPFVKQDILNKLIDAFDPEEGRAIVVPSIKGKRGNPALISTQFFDDIQEISGDMGAKAVISNNEHVVHAVEIDSASIFADIDTPTILARVTEDLSDKSE